MQFLKYLLLTALILVTATSKAEYFTIKDYNISLELFEDRTMQVTETITVEFTEPRHGIFRNIPDRYKYPENAIRVAPHRGEFFPVRIYDIEVEGHNFEKIVESWQTIVKIGDADRYVDDIQVYKISYKVDPSVILYEEHSEFYWNMIGTQWGTNIENVTYELVLPKRLDLVAGQDYHIYTGRKGQQEQNATINYENRLVYGETTEWLRPQEGITLAVKFPKDYFERPTDHAVLSLLVDSTDIPVCTYQMYSIFKPILIIR